MIYWRSQTEGLAAPWLDGNPNVVRRGRYVWVGSPVVSPDLDACQWLNMGNGWDVATLTDPQKLRPQDYIKPLSWSSMAPPVEDALGRQWLLPALLGPDGTPCVAQSMRRENGQWVRDFISASQEAAVAFAQQIRAEQALTVDDLCNAVTSIIDMVYYVDPETVATLGLIDDVLLYHAPRIMAGLCHDIP